MSGAWGQHVVDNEEQAASAEKVEEEASARLPSPLADDPQFLVSFDSGDPDNPHNWSTPYRSWLTAQLGFLALAASAASAIIAPANKRIATYFNVGQELVVLNVSLYVLVYPYLKQP